MHLVMTTFDRKPPYVKNTLDALFYNNTLLDLGGNDRLTLLVTERNAAFLPMTESYLNTRNVHVACLTDAQLAERDRLSPRQRTKLATRLALEMGADVVLQDDIDFAPNWWPRFNALLPFDLSHILISLYYPFTATTGVGLVPWIRNYWGHQAMFYGEDARKVAITYLRDPREEADDNALARMLGQRHDIRLYACIPSLIQHTGTVSTIKSRGHKAPTFGLTIDECNAVVSKPRKRIEWPKR